MDAKTSNFFLFLWLFSIVIWTSSSNVDATAKLAIEELENMLEINSEKDNWPKLPDPSTGQDEPQFYVMIFRKGENEVKFAPKLISNHTDDKSVQFSFEYWTGENVEYRFFDPKDSTKTIVMNKQADKQFKDATVPKPLTIGDLKTMYLTPAFSTEEHRLFLRKVEISDFFNYYDQKNFKENPTDKYTLKKDANKIAVLQKVYQNEQFDKVCIKMNLPAKSELYLSLEGDTHIMQLPLEVFNAIQDGVCLQDILAMNPRGRFMLMVRTMTDQTEDKFVEFEENLSQAEKLSPKKPDTIVEKGWIYYYPNSDYYDLELKAPNKNAKFFACDSMANCFDYKTSDYTTFKLNEDQKNKLKDSLIIRRFASNVKNEEYKVGLTSFEEKTISWLKDQIKVEGSKIDDSKSDSSKSLKLTIDPQQSPGSPITLTIPYIDLRVFSPKVKIDSPASVETISILKAKDTQMKIEHEKIEQFFKDGKIELSEFLKPEIKDLNDFNDFKYEFKITSKARFEITIILDPPNDNPDPVVAKCFQKDATTTSCLFRSKWVMAPYKVKRWNFGSNKFNFEKDEFPDQSIVFKRQIISFDGKLLSETSLTKQVKNKQTFEDNVDEEVEGPIKVFYWIDFLSRFEDLTAKIDLEDKTLSPPINGPVSKIYDPAYYEKSDQTCPKGFEWVGSRCMLSDKSHPSLNENCDDALGCTNIFDKHLMKMTVYINDVTNKLEIPGKQSFNDLGITEMYTPATKENLIVLKKDYSILKDNDDQEDFCIKFKHFGYKIKLLAGVEPMPEYDFQFNHDLLSMTDGLFTSDSICASQLFYPPKDTIVLSFVDPDQNSELLEKSVADLTLDSGHPINQLIDGLMQKEFKNQEFFIDSKNNDFIKVEPGIIKFSFPKDKANEAKNQESFQRILTTKFLKMPINNQIANKKIDIGLKYSGDFLDYGGNVWIQFRPQSKSTYNIKKWELQTMNHLNYEPINQNLNVTFLQVQFVFLIKNIEEMKELMEQKNQNQVDFLIEELSINDPCVGETNSLTDFCSGVENACKRNFSSNSRERAHYCQCPDPIRYGEECENFNFCGGQNKTTYCNKYHFGECKNDEERKSWYCTCNHEQTWIPIEEKCLDKLGLDCKGGQIIEVNNGHPQCVCPDGQVNIGNDNTPKCVEYDVCNQDHRKAKGDEPEIPCEDVNAECKKTSSTYQCVCKGDMMNDEGEFGPKAYCLDRLCELNLKCQQRCSLETVGKTECLCYKNYKLIPNKDNDHNCQIKQALEENEKKCLPEFDIDQLSILERAYLKEDNNTCGCKLEGYNFDDTSKKCMPNANDPVKTKLNCGRVIKFPNGTTKFVGPEGKQFDHVYGQCDYPKCSQPDQIVFVEDENNSECLAVCETSIFNGCTDKFSRCDSTKVMEQIHKIVKNETENGIPIIFKEKYDILNDTTLCDCIDGFTKNAGDQCVIDPKRKMFEIGVEFNQAINGKTTIESYFKQILKYFFKKRKNKPTIDEKQNIKVECDGHDNKCTAFIAVTPASALEPQNIVDYLKNHCFDESSWKKNSETSKNCNFILPRNDDDKDVVFVLSRAKDGNITSNFNRCFSKPCEHFKHTICKMRDQNPFEFSCDCDGFYKNSKQKILDLPETHQCEMKTCEENNIHCMDQTAKCEMFEPHVGYGIDVPMVNRFKETNISEWYFGSFGAFRDEPFPLCFCPNGKVVADINEYCPK